MKKRPWHGGYPGKRPGRGLYKNPLASAADLLASFSVLRAEEREDGSVLLIGERQRVVVYAHAIAADGDIITGH